MRPHRSHRAYRVPFVSLSVAAVAIAAGGSSSGSSTGHTTSGTKAPLMIGASLSLTGDFSADGQAYKKGYEFWAAQVNAKGGILGRKVQLKILNDNSSPTQVVTNYQTLISSDHVALTFGPFSSLLTAPAAAVAHRYGYAFVEGAGGATSVFAQNRRYTQRTMKIIEDGIAAGELRATGLAKPRAREPGPDPLTPQEREIAALAAAGLSNKQIAQRLFLSHKTVGNHLFRIFPKLGITSRAALRDALPTPPAGQTAK